VFHKNMQASHKKNLKNKKKNAKLAELEFGSQD
jgi:hypothetical protein